MSHANDARETAGSSSGSGALKLDARPFVPQQSQEQRPPSSISSAVNAAEFVPTSSLRATTGNTGSPVRSVYNGVPSYSIKELCFRVRMVDVSVKGVRR